MRGILIAGIGNIFQGDDAFGCETVRQLQSFTFPSGVKIEDFGIRSYDLAYELTNDYDAIILVDAASRGQEPGTVYLIEPDAGRLGEFERAAIDAHAMNPVSVIQMAQSLGGVKGKLFLVGCEPANLGGEQGEMGLSQLVQEAIPQAVAMIRSLIENFAESKERVTAGLESA